MKRKALIVVVLLLLFGVVTSFYEYGYKTVYQMYAYKKTGKKPTSLNNEVKLLIVNQDNVDTYQSELKE